MNKLKIVRIILIVVFVWVAITLNIQRFMCTKLTETEIFLNIPKSFICNFKKC